MSVDQEDSANNYDELQSFITGTLKAIVEGIADAQSSRMTSPFETGVHAYNAPKEVMFDIAVTAERASSTKGGFQLKILSVGANAGGEAEHTNSTATRIQFSVRTEFKRNKTDIAPLPVQQSWNKK